MGARRKKLLTVVRLWLLTPEKFGRTCRDCKLYVHDEQSGRVAENRSGIGPMMRMKAMGDPPCHECGKTIGLKVRHWTFANDPPMWCYNTFRHWRTMEAVKWHANESTDPIVRRNALLFSSVRDSMDRGRAGAVIDMLGLLRR